MKEQNMRGLPEEDWFRWVCLLVNAGYPEAAKAFSEMSTKHDGRSEERIQQVTEKVGEGGGLMTRCTTFGCGEDRIRSYMDSPLPPTD